MTELYGTQVLADWTATLTLDVVPAAVRQVAVRSLIDTLGVMLAGVSQPPAVQARALVRMTGGSGRANVVGSAWRKAAPAATFANAVAAHAWDFDDNCYAGFVHGSAVIVPAALAVAQQSGATGEQLLTALVAGAECQYRLGMALGQTLYDHGWWTTSVLGTVGACAAAARLLGLDSTATANALALAIGGTGGMKSVFGCDAKPLLAGKAAEAGVLAALLAQHGARGPLDTLEHRYGLATLYNEGKLSPAWLSAPQDDWCLLSPGIDIKRIPVCLSSHAAVDAVMAIVIEQCLSPEDIAHISCDVPPLVIANLIYSRPQNSQQAQFSMPFAIAASLCFGELTLAHLERATLSDSRVMAIMSTVSVCSGSRWHDADLLRRAPEGAWVEVTTRDGSTYRDFRMKAHGSALSPLSDDELGRKFLQCAGRVLDVRSVCKVLDRLWKVSALPTLDAILDC
ncbi:MmgE/PrpD family protein [Pectobacterium cacticida]|uniref:MmgE/PrpD family protein n=1 Tax=Pectobacterium cacticida TaxID=69221 RepID=UPI002FEFA4AB